MPRPTVLIVDDHPGFRAQARALLVDEGMNVVGEAFDGPSCLAQIERLRPDVVLLDIRLPGEDGFAVAERIATRKTPPAVVLTSSRTAADQGPRIAASPARGFVPKQGLSAAVLLGIAGLTAR